MMVSKAFSPDCMQGETQRGGTGCDIPRLGCVTYSLELQNHNWLPSVLYVSPTGSCLSLQWKIPAFSLIVFFLCF